jgi:tetratricopeptide (TPR) repeat protein
MRRCFLPWLSWVPLLAPAALAQPGAAEPGSPEAPAPEPSAAEPATEQARDAFRLGSALARQGQWNEALAAFERSQQLRPHAVTLFNVGYVERALGHYTRARKNLRTALDAQGDAALPEELAVEARAYLTELERKLSRTTILVDSETAIAIDGRPLEAEGSGRVFIAGTAPLGPGTVPGVERFELLANPGHHTITLSRDGRANEVFEENLAPGSGAAIRWSTAPPELEEKRSPATGPDVSQGEADTSALEDGASNRTWMWISYGVGAAGVVTGSVFGILAITKEDELSELCDRDKRCDPQYDEERQRLGDLALASTIGFIVGGVGAAAGTYFLLTESETRPASGGPSARPWIGVGSIGMSGKF